MPTSTIPLRSTLTGIIAAPLVGAVGVLAVWWALGRAHLPAFSSSNVLPALSTFGSALIVILVAAVIYRMLRVPHRPRWEQWFGSVVIHLAPAGLVATVLALPLASTRLYLDGISIDQGFRTQFLTRMTASPSLADMNYANMPTFYPAGWFLPGGVFARLIGLPGWAAFQPWSLVTLAAAAGLLVPVWHRMTGSLPLSGTIALATTAIMLTTSSEEPYAAIVAMGIPAAAVMAVHAVNGRRWALVGITLFLGVSATFYTLYTGINALTVVLIGVVAAVRLRRKAPLVRVVVIGVGSLLIASVFWAPYLWALLTQPHDPTGTAQHYLPKAGTQLPLPMFTFTLAGMLSLVGLVWIVTNLRLRMARALGVALLAYYGWVLLSMVMTLLGTTLLGFRLTAPIVLILTTAGILAIAQWATQDIYSWYPQPVRGFARQITAVITVLAVLAGIGYAASIPFRIRDNINLAYSDTDGDGIRADLFPADSTQFFARLNDTIEQHGYHPDDTIILSDDQSFLAYYPYYSYQAMTAHYANPLGQFSLRNKAIEEWAQATTPDELDKALKDSPGEPPQVMIFRGKESDPLWNFALADDIYPNNPNVRFRTIHFHSDAFASGWTVTTVGPFVVVMRSAS